MWTRNKFETKFTINYVMKIQNYVGFGFGSIVGTPSVDVN